MKAAIPFAVVLSVFGLAMTSPVSATTSANRARDEETVRTTVHYGDLDLQTRAGTSVLYSRLSEAATHVCGNLMEPYARLTPAYRRCRDDALAAAVHELDRPLLTETYAEHGKRA
jgi:UrcA family protein